MSLPATAATVGAVAAASLLVVAACLRVAPALPPASPRAFSSGVVLAGAVASVVAAGTLPAAGLLVVPVVPIAVAYLAFGAAVRVRPATAAARPVATVGMAALAGVAGFLVWGVIGAGPEYLPHVLRPPSLVLSAVALSLTVLSGFPLGTATRRRSAWRWPAAAALVGLPAATVLAVGLRSWNLTGRFVPAVLSITAILLAIPAFRVGHAVAGAAAGSGGDDGGDGREAGGIGGGDDGRTGAGDASGDDRTADRDASGPGHRSA